MELRKKVHHMIMKNALIIFILINVSCYAQDTLPIFRDNYHNYLIEKEINCCKSARDQLKCVDSLIQFTLKNIDYLGKGNYPKIYFDQHRKLLLYHFYAGNISGLRGDLEQSLAYFKQMEIYFDTLSKNKKDERFIDLKYVAHYQKIEFCSKAYREDSVLFNRCNCMQFFPESENEITRDTIIPDNKLVLEVKKQEFWGEFYRNDTLRIDNNFVSSSSSIAYFKKVMQPLILQKLLQNPPVFSEILGDPSLNLKRDTIICKLSSKYTKGNYEKKCEIVFASSKNAEKLDFLLILLTNMEFPGFMNNIEIFIPIVVTTENTKNANKATIYDDHFLVEALKLKRIEPK